MSIIGNFLRVSPSKLSELQQEPDGIEALLYPESGQIGNERHLDLDKAWHIIHFLLAGEAWGGRQPFGSAICGGTELGDVDVGYGPARFLTLVQVREVASALSDVSSTELWSRFDAAAASSAQIYPAGSWTEEHGEYVEDYFEKLKRFYAVAAQNNEAVLLYLN